MFQRPQNKKKDGQHNKKLGGSGCRVCSLSDPGACRNMGGGGGTMYQDHADKDGIATTTTNIPPAMR